MTNFVKTTIFVSLFMTKKDTKTAAETFKLNAFKISAAVFVSFIYFISSLIQHPKQETKFP